MPSVSKIRAGKYGVFGIGAKQMAQAFTVDGLHFDGSISVSRFGICSTSAGTAGKLASTAATFALQTGTTVIIKFTKRNTAPNPTLNVNGTGAKAIMLNGTTAAGDGSWAAGETLKLTYDGTYWQAVMLATGNANAAGRVKIDDTLAITGGAADAAALGTALADKQNIVPAVEGQYMGFDAEGNAVAVTPDAEPTNGSHKLATSGGIYAAILNQYKTATITDVAVASFTDGADNVPVKTLTVNVTPVQSGSGDPSPENVRPISGWTGCDIGDDPAYSGFVMFNQLVKDGNFPPPLPPPNTVWDLHDSVISDGILTASGAGTNRYNGYYTDVYVPGHIYYCGISLKSTGVANVRVNTRKGGLTSANSYIQLDNISPADWTRYETVNLGITASNMNGMNLVINAPIGETVQVKNLVIYDLTKMFGETVANQVLALETETKGAGCAWVRNLLPNDYYAYNTGTKTLISAVNGEPYGFFPVSWQSAAGTVYGGTLTDNGDGTWTLVKTIGAPRDLSTLNWGYVDSMQCFAATFGSGTYKGKVISSAYGSTTPTSSNTGTDNIVGVVGGATIRLRDSRFGANDVTAFKAALVGVDFCLTLGTPVEYDPITAESVKTLLGDNNIFADCGNINTLVYRKNINAVIDEAIAGN